jgi:hypothetical protein
MPANNICRRLHLALPPPFFVFKILELRRICILNSTVLQKKTRTDLASYGLLRWIFCQRLINQSRESSCFLGNANEFLNYTK